MYDDIREWVLSVIQVANDFYISEPIIAPMLTALLLLIMFYGPVNRKSLVGYVSEALKTIAGEFCQIIEQFIGESRSLTGFSGALHYIFFGKFSPGVKFIMVNYIAIFCSVVSFFTSWLALKEFFGYPCGLFLAFVLQIVILLFSFQMGQGRKQKKQTHRFRYFSSEQMVQNIIEEEIADGTTQEDMSVNRISNAVGLGICIIISFFCMYTFVFNQYIKDTLVYDTTEYSYDLACKFRKKVLDYRADLRTYLLDYMARVDEILNQQINNEPQFILDNDLKRIEEARTSIMAFLDHSLEMDESEYLLNDIRRQFYEMTDLLTEQDSRAQSIFVKRTSEIEDKRRGAEKLEDTADLLYGVHRLFLDDSVKSAMDNYIKLVEYEKDEEGKWLRNDPSHYEWLEVFSENYDRTNKEACEEHKKNITNSIMTKFEKYASLPQLSDIDGVRVVYPDVSIFSLKKFADGMNDADKSNDNASISELNDIEGESVADPMGTESNSQSKYLVARMEAVNATDEYKEIMDYYWLTCGELTITHCVIKSLKYFGKTGFSRIPVALFLSAFVNIVYVIFCVTRRCLVWPGNSRKSKQLVKSILLRSEPSEENTWESFRFSLAGFGVLLGAFWSIYSKLDTFQGREVTPLEKMLIGLVIGFSAALTVEVILHKLWEANNLRSRDSYFMENRDGSEMRPVNTRIATAQTAAARQTPDSGSNSLNSSEDNDNQTSSTEPGEQNGIQSEEQRTTEAFMDELHFWSIYLTEDALRLFQQCSFCTVYNGNKSKLRLFISNSNAGHCKLLVGQLVNAALAFPVYDISSEQGPVRGYVFSRKLLVLLSQCVFERREDIQDVPTAFMEDIRDHDEGA